MEYRTVYPSPLGLLTLASDGAYLTGLWLEGQKYFGAGRGEWEENGDLAVFAAVRCWLDDYFAGKQPETTALPLRLCGTKFQIKVWQRLRQIPYGRTLSYSALAAELGCGSARAVGAAVGRNPISIIIPCHRVLGADGSLTGYAGGVERKEKLLAWEGAI